AALAYYSVFSLIPLLLLGIGVAGAVVGKRVAEGEVLTWLRDLVGDEPRRAAEHVIRDGQATGTNPLRTAVGRGVRVGGARGVRLDLQAALTTIWQPPPRPGLGWLGRVSAWLGSFAAVLGAGLLLLAMMLASVLLNLGAVDMASTLGNAWLPHALNV